MARLSIMVTRAFVRRYGASAAAVFAAWWLAAYVVLPRVVRSAYEGTSFETLNRVISGQEFYAVDRYLTVASRIARAGSALLILSFGAGFLGYVFRDPLRRAWHRLARTEPVGDAIEITSSAMCLGLLFGLVEISTGWIRYRWAGISTTFNNPDLFWMGPLAVGALFGLLALLAFFGTRSRRSGLSYRLVFALCHILGFYGLLRGLRLGLHPIAAGALSIGVGVQVARLLDTRDRIRRLLRRLAVPLAGAAVLVPLITSFAARLQGTRAPATAAASTAPSILLLVLDTVRGENLGMYGYQRGTTSHLDALATRGVIFDRAIAPSPWTLPSHATLFTGRYPHELQVAWDVPVSDAFPTIAEVLGAHGYASGGFVANKVNAGRGTGLARGFDRYVDHTRSFRTWLHSAFVPRRLSEWAWGRLPMRSKTLDRKYAAEVNREFLTWLDELDGGPFFAFLNYFDAHGPYEMHKGFLPDSDGETKPIIFDALGREQPASDALARDIAAYDSSISDVDHHIGLLFEELRERGLLERTIVIVIADHGEQLGERGLMDHGNSLYSQLLRVPLLLYGSGQIPTDTRVSETVSLRDLPATIIDLAGIEAGVLPGLSLRRFWDPDIPNGSTPALSEVEAAPHAGFEPGPTRLGAMQSVVDGTLHYIRGGDGREELYDLESDPRERHNLGEGEFGQNEIPRLRRLLDSLVEADGSPGRRDE